MRNVVICSFSCTPEEKALLQREAKREGVNFSEFCRRRFFGRIVRARPARVLREADGNSRKRKLLPSQTAA